MSNKVALGVGLGIGFLVLLALIAGVVKVLHPHFPVTTLICFMHSLYCRRKRYTHVQNGEVVDGGSYDGTNGPPKSTVPNVSVIEI